MANIPPIKSIEDIYIFTRGGTVLDVQKGVKIKRRKARVSSRDESGNLPDVSRGVDCEF